MQHVDCPEAHALHVPTLEQQHRQTLQLLPRKWFLAVLSKDPRSHPQPRRRARGIDLMGAPGASTCGARKFGDMRLLIASMK